MKRPQITKTASQEILRSNNVTDKVCIIGIRGYYLDSFGKKGENDRNVYDDAIIVISPRKYMTFIANTDPSVYRLGIATLKTGIHRYYKGKHKQRYWALRLVGEQAPVTRDGQKGDKVGIALNIHKGGYRTTGSEGCQTLHPEDWDDFIELVYDEMDFYNQETVPYILIDEKDRRMGKFKMPHLLTIEDREIDNLLLRFDNEIEPAASKIDCSSTQNPSSSEVLNQSNLSDESASIIPQLPQQNAVGSIFAQVESIQGKIVQGKEAFDNAIQTYNQVKDVAEILNQQKDGKKSLWTVISQSFFQLIWAIGAFFVGIPREVWIAVAVIVGALAFYYLYRQIALGKIRETTRQKIVTLQ